MNKLTWKCHVCGDTRADSEIDVHTTDLSKEFNLPDGSFKQNVRYCNDRLLCINGAKTVAFVKQPRIKGGAEAVEIPN